MDCNSSNYGVRILVVCLAVLFSGGMEKLNAALIAQWHFDESSGTALTDSSGNGNHGSIMPDESTGPQRVSGRSGNALSFDGSNDYALFPAMDKFSAFTLELWVNPDNPSYMNLFNSGPFILTKEKAGLLLRGDDNTYSSWLNWNSLFPSCEWNHLIAAWDGSTMTLYLNGVMQGTSSFDGGVNGLLYQGSFRLGSMFNQYYGYFKGKIDEVSFYSHAMTSTEVQQSYLNWINGIEIWDQSTAKYPGILGVNFSRDLDVRGSGTAPYSWSISSGQLPTGLSLNSSTGEISGVPQSGGTYTFTVQATDSSSPILSAQKQLAVEIVDPYSYSCTPLAGANNYSLGAKNWMDETDPATALPALEGASIFAAPGEYEPFAFVIYAETDLDDVQITPSSLVRGNSVIPASNIEIRYGMRVFQRSTKYCKVIEGDYSVTTRFLRTFQALDIKNGQFREIYVCIKVPDDIIPGIYKGTITVNPSGNDNEKNIDVTLEVMPFQLNTPENKKYGIFFTKNTSQTVAELELEDVKNHGAYDVICPRSWLEVQYSSSGGQITVDYSPVTDGLDFLDDNGFSGTVVIYTGLEDLAFAMGYSSSTFNYGTAAEKTAMAAALSSDQDFQTHAASAINGLKTLLNNNYPQFDIYLAHMGEVFCDNRLPLYIALTSAAQQVSGLKYYNEIYTYDAALDTMRAQIDPYIDFRHHQGNYWERWLTQENNTIAAYESELSTSGDLAGAYYNPHSIDDCSAEWNRLRLGLLNTIMPFSFQMPYVYYSGFVGDRFNDLDGSAGEIFFAFYWPDDSSIVYTKGWEGYREGVDDMKYLVTLAAVSDDYASMKPTLATEVNTWLANVQDIMPEFATPVSTGSPVTEAIAATLSCDYYQNMRYAAATYTKRFLLDGSWSLDDGTGTTVSDFSGNGINGTLMPGGGAEPQWVDGRVDSALYFDGTDDYVILDDPITISRNSGAVSLWFNASSLTTGYHSLLGGRKFWYDFIGMYGSTLKSEANYNEDLWQYGPSVSVNTWYHLVLSADGGVISAYLNGSLVGTRTTTHDMVIEFMGVNICPVNGVVQHFHGIIDEVTIYSHPLTTAEVYLLYTSQ